MNLYDFFKNVFFIVFTFHFLTPVNAQSAGDYRSNAAIMQWDAADKWETWDTITHDWIAASVAPDHRNAIITVQPYHTVIVNFPLIIDQLRIQGEVKNVSATLTITDGIGDDLLVEPGGKFINEGSKSLILNQGTVILHDSLLNYPTCIFQNKGMLINENAVFKNTGTLINAANSFIRNSGEFLTGGSIVFEAESYYQHDFSSINTTAGTIPKASWQKGSTCEIRACGNAFQPGALNQTFHHFIWNNTSQPHDFNLIANPNTITGNFEIKNTNGKRLAYKGGSSGELVIADSLKITGGYFTLTNGASSTTIHTHTYFQNNGILDLSASNASCTLQVTNRFVHTGGEIQQTGVSKESLIQLTGSEPSFIESIGFRTNDVISFKINKEKENGSCHIESNKIFILHEGTSFSLTDNSALDTDFEINGTFDATTSSWLLTNGNTLVSGQFINRSTKTVAANSSSSSLHFPDNGSYIHASDGGEIISASWEPKSTVLITGIKKAILLKNGGQHFGNIHWNCKQQDQACTLGEEGFEVLGNFQIESTGTERLLFPDIDFKIAEDLLLQNDSRLQISSKEGLFYPNNRHIAINGNVSVLHSSSLEIGRPNTDDHIPAFNVYRDYHLHLQKDFIYTSVSPIISFHHKSNETGDKNASYRLMLHFEGNQLQRFVMKPQPENMENISKYEQICHNAYKIFVDGKKTNLLPQVYDLKVHAMEVSPTDSLTLSQEDINIIQYASPDSSGAQEAPYTLIAGILDMGLNILTHEDENGSFHLTQEGTLMTCHTMGIDSIQSVGCIQTTGKRLFHRNATYIYNGFLNQETGTGLPSVITGKLVINNSCPLISGGVQLTRTTLIPGTLHLNKGKLITNSAQQLFIGSSGTVIPAGGTEQSFVEGPFGKIGLTANEEFTFPLGNKNKWARLGIKSAQNKEAIQYLASYSMADPIQISSNMNAELHHISSREYWTVSASENDNATVKLYWESGNFSGIYSIRPDDLKITHYTNISDQWRTEIKGATSKGTSFTGSIEAQTDIAMNNYFTFGSSTTVNPLPIQLIFLSGTGSIKGNILNWITASEKNNRHFIIQRSEDGIEFTSIGIVNGHGHSTSLLHYSYFDSVANFSGFYYRLKQVDYDGNSSYSQIIRIEKDFFNDQELFIYPNPASTDDVYIHLGNTISYFYIYNLLGKRVYDSRIQPDNKEHVFIPVVSGIYFIQAMTIDGKKLTRKLIKN